MCNNEDGYTLQEGRQLEAMVVSLQEQLRQIKEGVIVPVPINQEHADNLMKVGSCFGKEFKNGEWK